MHGDDERHRELNGEKERSCTVPGLDRTQWKWAEQPGSALFSQPCLEPHFLPRLVYSRERTVTVETYVVYDISGDGVEGFRRGPPVKAIR